MQRFVDRQEGPENVLIASLVDLEILHKLESRLKPIVNYRSVEGRS